MESLPDVISKAAAATGVFVGSRGALGLAAIDAAAMHDRAEFAAYPETDGSA
jgi:hypothetical protein